MNKRKTIKEKQNKDSYFSLKHKSFEFPLESQFVALDISKGFNNFSSVHKRGPQIPYFFPSIITTLLLPSTGVHKHIVLMSSVQRVGGLPWLLLSSRGLNSNNLLVHVWLLSRATYPENFHFILVIFSMRLPIPVFQRISSCFTWPVTLIHNIDLSIFSCGIYCFGSIC